jgi:periplasmic divalent cation tolerance protein
MFEASSIVIVLTTFPADRDAAPFARALVDERLAACVNILPPMESIYRWQGVVEQASERQLFIKTSLTRFKELKKRIAALHPYELPELVVLQATGDTTYLQWVADQTRVTEEER